MKPLLWKEYRELRTTLLVWLAGLAVVQVWRWMPGTVPDDVILGLFPAVGMLAAVELGSELLTRERQARTTEYLLVRPVSREQIVWAKFIAGSIMLLLFVAALLAVVLPPRTPGRRCARRRAGSPVGLSRLAGGGLSPPLVHHGLHAGCVRPGWH